MRWEPIDGPALWQTALMTIALSRNRDYNEAQLGMQLGYKPVGKRPMTEDESFLVLFLKKEREALFVKSAQKLLHVRLWRNDQSRSL
jgi:hypothetical protein